jgi:chromosome segregation ATPase
VFEELNAELAETKDRLNRLGELKASLAPARERLTEEAHRVQRMEDCLAEVEGQIQAMQSFTLQSLIDSLLWRKEGKLNHLREELARLQPEFEVGEQTLRALDTEVKAIETEAAGLSDAEGRFKALCERKREQILAEGSEAAKALEQLASHLGAAKNERQALRKAAQLAKSLVERVRTMSKAQHRAQNKKMYGGGGGILGSAVNALNNTIQQEGADVHVRRLREGLEEISCSILGLAAQDGCERDAELARVATLIAQAGATLNSFGGATAPLLDLICQAQGLLQTKVDEVEPTITSLEARRIELIENA